jgi:hypothetical protein
VSVATVACAMTVLTAAVTPLGSTPRSWPPFLHAREEYPPQIANAVSRLWIDATFTRTVSADPVPVPLSFYLRFIDMPDVAASAARHLRLTTYDVKVRGDDWYEATDGDAAHGVYRVLARDGGRRIVLSWGTHRGSIFGSVGGSALTQLEFGESADHVTQRLAVNVIIDNGIVASISRPFLLLFGWFVDRKLTEAFQTTAAAAAWAHAKPDEFCAWLDQTVTDDRRAEVLDMFDECGRRFAVRGRNRGDRFGEAPADPQAARSSGAGPGRERQ